MTTTTFTIDCDTCPGRGRLCGDCFVPVLGRVWLQEPSVRPDSVRPDHEQEPQTGPTTETSRAESVPALYPEQAQVQERRQRSPLDSDELAAVSAFVRAGLVDPDEAQTARAEVTGSARSAAG